MCYRKRNIKSQCACNIAGLADGRRGHSAQPRFCVVRGGQTGVARDHCAPETGQAAPDPHQFGFLSAPEFEQAQTRMGRVGGEDEGAQDAGKLHDCGRGQRRHGRRDRGERAVDGRTQVGHLDHHHHVDDAVPDVPVRGHRTLPGKPVSVIAASPSGDGVNVTPSQFGSSFLVSLLYPLRLTAR